MIKRTRLCVLVVIATAASASASPNAALDHPVYEQLARLRALGRLPAYTGGFYPLS